MSARSAPWHSPSKNDVVLATLDTEAKEEEEQKVTLLVKNNRTEISTTQPKHAVRLWRFVLATSASLRFGHFFTLQHCSFQLYRAFVIATRE